MAKFKLKKQPVQVWGVSPRPGDQQPTIGADYHPHEDRPAHGMGYKDKEIEDAAYRAHIAPDKGALSFAVEAGDERLGEIYVSTQFEVKPGDHPGCVANHEAFTGNINEWLKQILNDILAPEVEVEVSIDAVPYKEKEFDINVERAVAPLVGPTADEKVLSQAEARAVLDANATVRVLRDTNT